MNQSLERDVLFHIQSAWLNLNYQIFSDQLKQPSFKLIDGESLLGQWDGQHRVISLQRTLIMASPWLQVLEVLKHEMAHQYVQEVCQVFDEPPHGPTFQRICRERGIESAASGELIKDPHVERLLSRVNKLLALAQSDNLHEAEQAAQRAQALLTQHHIKLESQVDDDDLFKRMSFCQLGQPKGRHYQYEYALINLLSDHFFVSCIWVSSLWIDHSKGKGGEIKEGRVVEACGRHEDLEIASYVYDFVLNHLDIAWRSYRATHKAKGLRKRLSFSLGLVRGFTAKLSESKPESKEDRALVQVSQHRAQRYLERRYQHTQRRNVGGWTPSSDYRSGFEEGHALNLRRGVHDSGNSESGTRRLGRG